MHSHSGSLSYLDIPSVFLHMPPYYIYVSASTQAQKDLRGFWEALRHKKGQSSLFDAGQAGRVLAESWQRVLGRVHRESCRVLGRGKHRSCDAEGVRGGRRPDAVRQCTRAGSIFFLFYFQEGSLGIFFTTTLLGGFFFYYLWTQHCTPLTTHNADAPSF